VDPTAAASDLGPDSLMSITAWEGDERRGGQAVSIEVYDTRASHQQNFRVVICKLQSPRFGLGINEEKMFDSIVTIFYAINNEM
jgi:hypothetical protein